ncbi:MAG: hypothetical protein HDS28_06935 [Bacteroides sp.]|nr:hypothetical protein [Bacteroides sp.]
MKKFFLMLAVALPMFFMASCGDDNDDDVKIEYTMPLLTKSSSDVLSISNISLNLEWGDDQEDVKDVMKPFSYVLNTDVSTSSALAYTYDADGSYPFYIYAFVGGSLNSSSITITGDQDDEIDLMEYFNKNGYKDVTTDEDDDLVYRSKDKLTLVHYGFDGENEVVTILWTPNNGTRANSREVLYNHLETVKALKNIK